ncbi:tetratricopeptide repeat protein [bacterium]|nr:tetratricopeptide repeat protein [bacterium]
MARANRPSRTRRLVLALAVVLSLPLVLGFSLPGEFARLMNAGDHSYAKGKFKEALARYTQASQLRPEDPQALFNRAAGQFRVSSYQKALADNDQAAQRAQGKLREYAEYNAGNCLYKMQRLDDAIERYKRALTLDPDDLWAKHNLEMAMRQKNQQKDKQQQQQQNQNQQKSSQKQDQNQQDKPQNNPSQDQQNQQQQPEQKPQDQPKQQQPSQADQQPLNEQEAAQLLSSLSRDDAELQKSIRRAPLTPERPTSKDW